jgi:hypothetical protein
MVLSLNALALLLGVGGAIVLWSIFGKNIKKYMKSNKKKPSTNEVKVSKKTEKVEKTVLTNKGKRVVLNDDDEIKLLPEVTDSNRKAE